MTPRSIEVAVVLALAVILAVAVAIVLALAFAVVLVLVIALAVVLVLVIALAVVLAIAVALAVVLAIAVAAVLQSGGRLLSSNSQAGGIHFPESVHLNHEMIPVAAFTATECYSHMTEANTVSMDYVYVEGDAVGRPRSQVAHVETWDMPLPEPEIEAFAVGASVRVNIVRDASFEPGHVTFAFDDPAVRITGIEVMDSRTAMVHTDNPDLSGKTLRFINKSLFYHHAGSTMVHSRD